MAHQLTIEERERISQLLFVGANHSMIARELGRAPSTISREITRNSVNGDYRAVAAQGFAVSRRRQRPLTRKMDEPSRHAYVVEKLCKFWAPEQIAGRARFANRSDLRVSHQTIYTWIKGQGELRTHWESFLRRRGRRRPKCDRRGRIPRQVEIVDRPKVVDKRCRLGDWEGDTVVGRSKSGCLITLVDRKSGYLLVTKAKDRTAKRVGCKIVQLMEPIPESRRHTLTLDNGKEFASHERVGSRLAIGVYFARPYRSWERGTNENTNGLLRQFIPKGVDLSSVSHPEVKRYMELINDRPRKRLGYRTPSEVFNGVKTICV